MKKIGKIRKYGLSFIALFVCLAVMATCFTFITPFRTYSASAADATGTTLLENVSIPTKCEYGATFDVPTVGSGLKVTVTAPNGKTVEPASGKVTANQVGVYTVTVAQDAEGGASQDFYVNVTLDKEFFLKVKDNGAAIKSNIKPNTSFELPTADVVYYDDNNILRSYPGSVNVWAEDSLGNKYYPNDTDAAKKTFTAAETGKVYITYVANLGTDGGKYYTEKYTVNVGATYSDTAAPNLTVSGLPSTISVNRAVTLPKATVTDDYDTNVQVKIEVLDPDGKPVRTVDINKYGYAEQLPEKLTADESIEVERDKNYPVIEFDNDKAMTFYPLKTGTYTITYTAIDDAGNSSTTKRATPVCGDSVAPVFQEIDDYQIPEKWGITVKGADGATLTDKGGKITLPIPYLVDNKDHMYAETRPEGEPADTDLISLYVRVTDSDRSKTFVQFKNILAGDDSDDSKFTPDGVYGATGDEAIRFNKNHPFTLDLSKYNRKMASDKDKDDPDKTGTYTIYYRAEDKAGNRSTKSYTVTVESEFEDKDKPSEPELTVPKYVAVPSDEYINIPTPSVTDGAGNRVHTEYVIHSYNVTDTESASVGSLEVKGGERAEYVEQDSKWYLVVNNGKSYSEKLELGNTLYFFVKVTDSVGNVICNTEDGTDVDVTTCKAKVNVITKATSESATMTYTGDIGFNLVTKGESGETLTPVDGSSTKIHTDDKVNAGGFSIATSASMRKYTGFEVSVVNANGKSINTTLETFTVYNETADTATINVKNITFTPGTEGKHYVVVRAFDVNGKNTVTAYPFDVEKSTQGTGTASAAVVPSNGSVNVKYALHNETMEKIGESGKTYFVVRKITGGVYSLMGSEIIAKTQGGYSVTDGYIDSAVVSSYVSFDKSATPYGANGGTYSFNITDSSSIVIEVQGAMPQHEEKNATIKLPLIYAYSENGAATVEVTVKDKEGRPVDVKQDEDAASDTYRQYSFVGAKDGAYTVSVTARRAKAEASATYVINVGDVQAPQFTVSGGVTTIRMKQGDTFTYADIVLAEGESEDGVTITKKIEDPSKEEISGATVNGSYKNYHDKLNNGSDIVLSSSGTYRVYYYAEDSLGNGSDSPIIVEISVTASGSSTPTTFTTLSTVLIIVAVVLLAGVIVYVVRFRKVKK